MMLWNVQNAKVKMYMVMDLVYLFVMPVVFAICDNTKIGG